MEITIMIKEPETAAGRKTMHTLTGSRQFPTTRWTLVVAAADPQRKEARTALVSLCEGYWYPLYAYLRRRGYSTDQAQDLTQEFFVRLLEGPFLGIPPRNGRLFVYAKPRCSAFIASLSEPIRKSGISGPK